MNTTFYMDQLKKNASSVGKQGHIYIAVFRMDGFYQPSVQISHRKDAIIGWAMWQLAEADCGPLKREWFKMPETNNECNSTGVELADGSKMWILEVPLNWVFDFDFGEFNYYLPDVVSKELDEWRESEIEMSKERPEVEAMLMEIENPTIQ